ncbi:hypothetical protein BDV96DRAFT_691029 [Lophiotrema nucula]|uniref:Uncharacterized protein n=1 Tax=Lophiotrema nucula TaxID=690887 RepID=A0A6A5YUL6_9PLEO|nr:hypothetical protein BDV96DRAFT_691029 [Lophiotrema nucula]
MDAVRSCTFWLNAVLRHATLIHEVNGVSHIGFDPKDYPQLDSCVDTLHQQFAVNPIYPSATGILIPKSHANFPYAFGQKRYNHERLLRQQRKKQHKQFEDVSAEHWLVETQNLRPTLERTAKEAKAKQARVKAKNKQRTKQHDRIINATRYIRDFVEIESPDTVISKRQDRNLNASRNTREGHEGEPKDVVLAKRHDRFLNSTRNTRDAADEDVVEFNTFHGDAIRTMRFLRLVLNVAVADIALELSQTRRLRGPVKPFKPVVCTFDGNIIAGLRNFRKFMSSAPLRNNDISRHLVSTIWLRFTIHTGHEFEENNENFPLSVSSLLPCVPISAKALAEEGLAYAQQNAAALIMAAPYLKVARDLDITLNSKRPYTTYSLAHKERPLHIDIPPFTDNDLFDLELSAKNRNFGLDIEIDFPKPSSYFLYEIFAGKAEYHYRRLGRMPTNKHFVRLETESWNVFATQASDLVAAIGERGFSFTSALSEEPHWIRSRRAVYELRLLWKERKEELRADMKSFFIDDEDRVVRKKQEMAWDSAGPFLFGADVLRDEVNDDPNSSDSENNRSRSGSSSTNKSLDTSATEEEQHKSIQGLLADSTDEDLLITSSTARRQQSSGILVRRASGQVQTLQLLQGVDGGYGARPVVARPPGFRRSRALQPPPGLQKPVVDLYRRAKGHTAVARPYMSKLAARYEQRPTKLRFKAHEDAPYGYTHFHIDQQQISDVPTNRKWTEAGYLLPPALVNNGMHHHTQPASDANPVPAFYNNFGVLQALGPNGGHPAIAFHFPLQEPEILRGCASWVERGLVGYGVFRRAGRQTEVLLEVHKDHCKTPGYPWAHKQYPIRDLGQELYDKDEWYEKRNAEYRAYVEQQARNGDQKAKDEVQICAVGKDSPLLVPNGPLIPNPVDDVFVDHTENVRVNLNSADNTLVNHIENICVNLFSRFVVAGKS